MGRRVGQVSETADQGCDDDRFDSKLSRQPFAAQQTHPSDDQDVAKASEQQETGQTHVGVLVKIDNLISGRRAVDIITSRRLIIEAGYDDPTVNVNFALWVGQMR